MVEKERRLLGINAHTTEEDLQMKKVIAVTALAATLMSVTPALASGKFSDVNETKYAWATESIDFMVDRGVLSGYPDGSFKPGNPVTKAEFAHMYHKLFPDVNNGSGAPEFADAKTNWAAADFAALFNGEDAGSFAESKDIETDKMYLNPNKQLTRWDFLILSALLTKQLDATVDAQGNKIINFEEELAGISMYSDIKVMNGPRKSKGNPFYTPEILIETFGGETGFLGDIEPIKADLLYSFTQEGIMQGSDGLFRPNAKVTRAEAVTILYRLFNAVEATMTN